MTEEKRREISRSRRSRRRRRRRSPLPGLLLLLMILILAGSAAWAGIRLLGSQEEDQSGTAVEPETFPGDQGSGGEAETSLGDQGAGGEPETSSGDQNSGGETDKADGLSTAEEKLASMTLEEKAAQLFIITPEALTGYTQVTQAGAATEEALERYPVGGLIYFSGNLESPEQVKAMTAGVQEYGEEITGVPLFLAIDEEGGRVARLGNNPAFPVPQVGPMGEIGASGEPERAYEAGQIIGGYLAEYGFNMDFAPDADVLTEPENTAIGDRSFGSDPETTAEMALRLADGLREQGVMPVFKHFPGHGATAGDTHEGYAQADRTLEELKERELVPFARAAQERAECIMAAHIAVPEMTGIEPASLSPAMLTGVLRNDLGFQGLIVTDALNMGAVTEHYTSGEAAVAALKAGADLLLMPEDFESAYEGVLTAVETGEISEERLNQSVLRILERKERMDMKNN